jgi:PQQ-like domain
LVGVIQSKDAAPLYSIAADLQRNDDDPRPAKDHHAPWECDAGGRIRSIERAESEIVVADPFTGEVKKRVHASYPNSSAALTTAGGLLFTGLGDGTFIAYDDTSLELLWKINVGAGINAPPMTFEAGGRQYVTVMTGLSRVSKGRITLTPELRDMRDQTMLFVFGL